MKAAKTDIGSRLWEYMKKNPLSSVEMAKNIGIAYTTLINIARKDTEPRMEVRCKIEKFLQEQIDKKG